MSETLALSRLSDLKYDPKNPRTISKSAAHGLSTSIEEFGDLGGIVFNIRTGQLITGHQRVNELKKKYGNLTIVDDSITIPSGEVFTIRIVDWPIEKQHAANIAANAATVQGQFTDDIDVLLNEIAESDNKIFHELQLNDLRHEDLPEVEKPKGEFAAMIETKREFPPKMSWAVIGMPFERFPEIATFLEDLA